MTVLTREQFNRVSSDEAQTALICLNCAIQEVQERWFWERWFRTERWTNVIAHLGTRLREASQAIEHVLTGTEKREVSLFYAECLTVYLEYGGTRKESR